MAAGATLGATFALLAPKPHPCFPTVPPWKGLGVCAPVASAPAGSGGLSAVLRLGLKPRASVLPRVCKTALLVLGGEDRWKGRSRDARVGSTQLEFGVGRGVGSGARLVLTADGWDTAVLFITFPPALAAAPPTPPRETRMAALRQWVLPCRGALGAHPASPLSWPAQPALDSSRPGSASLCTRPPALSSSQQGCLPSLLLSLQSRAALV